MSVTLAEDLNLTICEREVEVDQNLDVEDYYFAEEENGSRTSRSLILWIFLPL